MTGTIEDKVDQAADLGQGLWQRAYTHMVGALGSSKPEVTYKIAACLQEAYKKLREEEYRSQLLDSTMKSWIDCVIIIPPWITSKHLGQSFLCL